MKKVFNLILTGLTIAMLAIMIFTSLNENAQWVDLSQYKVVIDYITKYGPMILLCLFAFGGLLGKMLLGRILFIVILVLLVIFTISTFAPEWITSIFGAN